MAEDRRYNFTLSGFWALLKTLKAVYERDINIINVDMSCRDAVFTRTIPEISELPSQNSSSDEGFLTVVFDSYYNFGDGVFESAPGVYLYDENENTLYPEWADSENYIGKDMQWLPGNFYRSGNKDLFYGSDRDVCDVAMPLKVESILTDISNIGLRLNMLETTLNNIPKLTDEQKKDGKAYALVNGVYDDICGADYTLLAEKDATAQSLALKSLESGVLVIDGADEQMIEEMRGILGEERFNELASASVKTMELRPQLSIEEQIEAAKAAYDRRKAEALAEAEIVESSDVEPINKEKK